MRAVLIVVVGLTLHARASTACHCAERATSDTGLESSALVFEAYADRTQSRTILGHRIKEMRLLVGRVFKAETPPPPSLLATMATTCAFPFREGGTYLVFVSRPSDEPGRIIVSVCGATRELPPPGELNQRLGAPLSTSYRSFNDVPLQKFRPLSPALLRTAMRRREDAVRRCTDAHDLPVRVDVTLKIDGRGRVTDALVHGMEPGGSAARCIAELMRKIRFPRIPGGPISLGYPFVVAPR